MINLDNCKTLEEWVEKIENGEEVYPRHMIPNEEWKEVYIKNIETKSDTDVKRLLRKLLSPYTRKLDVERCSCDYTKFNFEGLSEESRKNWKENLVQLEELELNHRIRNEYQAWEGLTWILQLLPHSPYKAIEALGSYLDAEVGVMPDDRIIGIRDCIDIIEQKYIYGSLNNETLLNLKPRDFEKLIAKLYQALGYDTELTPATRDGGKDVIARIKRVDGLEEVYVECKRYKTTKLSKDTVRALGYIIQDDKATRGVIFCTGYASQELKNMDKRIQIWTIEDINFLLNAHLGTNWVLRLNRLLEKE